MSALSWYWHRLQAMDGAEMRGRLRKKVRAFFDQRRQRDWGAVRLESSSAFPKLPDRQGAPPDLRLALEKEVHQILKGHGLAFAHLPIAVDDPPKWHRDYLAGRDVPTSRSAFQLNHRQLPGGADIKMIWELSRWYQLVRLAQAGWLLQDDAAVLKCVRWLEDWILHNPPFMGWNWTSALESGIRLIQFTWIDALIADVVDKLGLGAEWDRLCYEILPSHAWFTWRHKSFGSSANNHLLGELSGLIVATTRWRNLEQWGAPLSEMRVLWEREVLAQFAPDGGNREQALNYHLFSFEFSWQACLALRAAGMEPDAAVEECLSRVARFFLDAQVPSDPWDYGDSDNGFVTPFFADERKAVQEWYGWFQRAESNSISFWLGDAPKQDARIETVAKEFAGWRIYPDTGIAVRRAGQWTLRLDLSPLGYLSTAAHGHLDALHLSVWYNGVAIAIDPGTGAYYADETVRSYLPSWEAHNGPRLIGIDWPRRLGPFLWSDHHPPPTWEAEDSKLTGRLRLLDKVLTRSITRVDSGDGWTIEDVNETDNGTMAVRWQFPPGSVLKRQSETTFRLERQGALIWMQVNDGAIIQTTEDKSQSKAGLCSPSFRRIEHGPCLELLSSHKPCVLRTTFLASSPS